MFFKKDDKKQVLNVIESDYKPLFNTYEKAVADFWTLKVLNFDEDKKKWLNIDKDIQDLFLLNNAYQMKTDSEVTNIYSLLSIVANGSIDLTLNYTYTASMEAIHALSYSYGLEKMFGSKAREILDLVYIDERILNRLKLEENLEEELKKIVGKFLLNEPITDYFYETLFKNIISTYIIEEVKFPYSFLVTWRINEGTNSSLQGFTQLIKRIAKDELESHTTIHKNTFSYINKKGGKLKRIFENVKNEFAKDYINKIYEDELMWIDYQFKDKEYEFINKKLAKSFIRYRIDVVYNTLFKEKLFNEPKNDIIQWYDDYRKLEKENASQQEQKSTIYNKGSIKDDLQEKLAFNKKITLKPF